MQAISLAKTYCLSYGGGAVEKVTRRQLNVFGDYSGHGVIGIAWRRRAGAVSSPLLQNELNLSHFRLDKTAERKVSTSGMPSCLQSILPNLGYR